MTPQAQQFKADSGRMTHDLRHRGLIQVALGNYSVVRDRTRSAYQDWESARQTAGEIKWEAVNHLDRYLAEFARKLEDRGTHVHW